MVNYNALVLPPSDYSGEFEWVSGLVDHLLHRSLAEETFSPCHELMGDARPTIRKIAANYISSIHLGPFLQNLYQEQKCASQKNHMIMITSVFESN